ncbi:MAG: helix-turn-helix domain-containing protein [Methylovirgula sp.]|uniref:helix-turn-helix transcriptional regulator n=1 Tax=Methylovirgula sp. TaxID=1978224 RepID=UPI003075EF66
MIYRIIFVDNPVGIVANTGMLTPAQIRAARALLNLSQDELAEASGLARQSIKNIERGVTDPRLSTAMMIKTTLEKAGVQFLEANDSAVGPGVALKTQTST